MVGNNLHKNGTYVYIDPIAIGAGSTRAIGGIPNIARLIGLGGYFLVTGVKHEVSDSGFNTSLDAMQEMSAFDIAANEKITALAHPAGAGTGEKKPEQSTHSEADADRYMARLESNESLEKEDGSDGGAPLTGDASGRTTGDAAEAGALPYPTEAAGDEAGGTAGDEAGGTAGDEARGAAARKTREAQKARRLSRATDQLKEIQAEMKKAALAGDIAAVTALAKEVAAQTKKMEKYGAFK
jgi:hypothetical protein